MPDFEMQLGELLIQHRNENPSVLIEILDQYISELEEKAERDLVPRPA